MNVEQKESQFSVRQPFSGVAVIDIRGELTAGSADPLAEAYQQVANRSIRTVVLSFKDLQYMNSSGIGLIVTLLIRAKRNSQRVFAAELSDHYRQIFDVTRLVEAISVFHTETEALAAARTAQAV